MKWLKKFFSEVGEMDLKTTNQDEVQKFDESNSNKVSISVTGNVQLFLIEDEDDYDYGRGRDYYVRIRYNLNVKFLDKEININSSFCINTYTRNKKDAYEFIVNVLSEGSEKIMERLKEEVLDDIKEHLKNNRINVLKSILEKNNNIEINMSFDVDKSKLLQK